MDKPYKKQNINGLEVYLVPFPQKEDNIVVQFYVTAGYCFAPKGKKHIPHLLEHAIANQLMKHELDFEAYSGLERLLFILTTNKKNFYENFEQFLISIFTVKLSKKDFNNEKRAMLHELEDKYSHLENKAFRALSQARYDSPFYAEDTMNTKEIDKSTLEEILNYHKKHFVRQNAKIVIGARKFDDKIVSQLKSIIKKEDIKEGAKNQFPDPGPYSKDLYLKEESNHSKSYIVMTWPCPSLTDDIVERVAINIIREMLVEGYKSILFQKLRIQEELLYDIHAETIMLNRVGAFAIYLSVDKRKIEKAINIIKKSIDEIKQKQLDIESLEKNIKENTISNNKEWKTNKRFDWIAEDIADFGEVHGADVINAIYKKINTELLSKIASKYLDHKFINIIEFS